MLWRYFIWDILFGTFHSTTSNALLLFISINLLLFALHEELLLSNSKTVNTWKISGMLIVYWPITIKFRLRMQSSKPQTNYHCCLLFSYLVPYWLISCNTITFHEYFWCSWFCEFHTVILLFCCSFTIKREKLEHQKYFWHVIVLQ